MRRWAAAGLVAVLAAGCLAGCGDDGPGRSEDTAGRPKLPGSVLGGGGGRGESADASAAVAAPGAATQMIAPANTITYRLAPGAEAPATEAEAYELVPAGGDAADRLARALGVEEVQLDPSGIVWSYSPDPDGTVSSGSVSSAPACAPDGACPEPPPPAPLPGALGEDEARAEAQRILADAGIDTAGGRFEVAGEPGFPTPTSVTYLPLVDGVPVEGLQTTISFGEHGRVVYANGYLAEAKAVGRYPLVDLATAVERLQRGVFPGRGDVHTLEAPHADRPMVGGDAADPSTGTASGGTGVDDGGGSTGSAGATGSDGSAGSSSPPSAGSSDPASPSKGSAEPGAIGPSEPGSTEPAGPAAPDEPVMTIEPQEPTPALRAEIVELREAELVLQLVHPMCDGEAVYLVPAFRFLPQGIAVPAVVDKSLQGSLESGPPACPGSPEADVPVGKPEPAPLPPEPARP